MKSIKESILTSNDASFLKNELPGWIESTFGVEEGDYSIRWEDNLFYLSITGRISKTPTLIPLLSPSDFRWERLRIEKWEPTTTSAIVVKNYDLYEKIFKSDHLGRPDFVGCRLVIDCPKDVIDAGSLPKVNGSVSFLGCKSLDLSKFPDCDGDITVGAGVKKTIYPKGMENTKFDKLIINNR